jgi:hypothetical protein
VRGRIDSPAAVGRLIRNCVAIQLAMRLLAAQIAGHIEDAQLEQLRA